VVYLQNTVPPLTSMHPVSETAEMNVGHMGKHHGGPHYGLYYLGHYLPRQMFLQRTFSHPASGDIACIRPLTLLSIAYTRVVI